MATNEEKDYTMWTKPMEFWKETPSNLVVNQEIEQEVEKNISNIEDSISKRVEPFKYIATSNETMRTVVK